MVQGQTRVEQPGTQLPHTETQSAVVGQTISMENERGQPVVGDVNVIAANCCKYRKASSATSSILSKNSSITSKHLSAKSQQSDGMNSHFRRGAKPKN